MAEIQLHSYPEPSGPDVMHKHFAPQEAQQKLQASFLGGSMLWLLCSELRLLGIHKGACVAHILAGLVLLFADASKPCRIELAENWKLMSSKDLQAEGASISVASYQDDKWYPIRRMPATVLQILQEDGVYPDLYVGKNLLEKVPQDLYKQDWWYRTTFNAPVNGFYTLEFPGINYRAEIWLNGKKIADNKQVAGMYAAHELNVTRWIKPGSKNVLAVKVTPEQLIQDVTGVELADSWFDWLNWKYVGYKGPKEKNPWQGVSFVPDRNAGIWKPVYLRATGSVSVNHTLVNSKLSLSDSIARLTVFTSLHNLSTQPVNGMLKGTISRQGKPSIYVEQFVTLSRQTKSVRLFSSLIIFRNW